MILMHEHNYSIHPQKARLAACDLTPLRYQRMCRSAALRKTRESAIPQEDVDAVIDLITEHPHIGSVKAHHTLINQEQALVSSGYSSGPIMANYEAYGFCGVLPKPYTKTRLTAALHAALQDS